MRKYFLRGIIAGVVLLLMNSIMSDCSQVFALDKAIKTGGYTLEYGKYKGLETDYDYDAKKPYTKVIYAELGKNKITINGITTKFRVKGNKLYIKKREMYEVIGNNKLLMLAGGGVVFEHE